MPFMRLLRNFGFAVTLICISALPSYADTRVALVIGNGAYKNAIALPNPRHDAEDVSAGLKRVGFDVIVGLDLDKPQMDEVTIRFARKARAADVAMFYYSGHAMQFAGSNYLMPVDAKLSDEADLRRMTRLDEIVVDLQQARNLRILVLDSCRDNPLADALKRSIGLTRAISMQRGLAQIDAPRGMIVAFATQAGQTAEDGTGRNSPYTTSFVRHIEDQDEIGTIFRRISADVYRATDQRQLPELSLSLIGEFYLRGKLEVTVAPSNAPVAAPQSDLCGYAGDHWRSAESIGTIAALEDHLARFPNCAFAGLAKARLESIKQKSAVIPPHAVSPSDRNYENGWLSGAEYQELFNRMVSQRHYPDTVEARVFGDKVLFKAAFLPYPKENFSFWSAHGITPDEFARRDRMYRATGYKLRHRQSVKIGDTEFVQATWLKN
jgi:hypothetical protein